MGQPAEDPQNTRTAGRFQPGQSGNPGGRPKGLASATREVLRTAVREGEDPALALVRFWAGIMADPKQKVDHRMKASELLADRGWGKAPQYAPIEDADPLELSDRAASEIAAAFDGRVDELSARRRRRAG